ncbi:hypothetical protein LJB77_01495 [Ruminococcaceae bacterium OttesenSCG-928-N02]|nr:hypothetical protein [Ruminococcaceae bacterium OttesenSCG-928-N02]
MAYYMNTATPPAQPKTQILTIENLLGADLTTSASTMAPARSPACPNMVRATPGKVRKRYGYRHLESYPGQVNGRYFLNGMPITHAGTALYSGSTLLHSGLRDARSCGRYLAGHLFLLDGANFWAISLQNGTPCVQPAAQLAYVPKITINKNPNGSAGAPYEAVNLLADAWQESFYVNEGTAGETVFQLSFGGLDATPVQVQVLQQDGVTWQHLTEGVAFTVQREVGTVTFLQAPGQSPLAGADNVLIRAAKDRTTQREKITKADICATYGDSANGQRLFVSGNPAYKNRDFFSAANNPTYFSDLDYSILGSDSERITGYSLVGNYIAAHKGEGEGAVYLRQGTFVSEPGAAGTSTQTYTFKTGNVISGPGALATASFATLNAEPLFLTRTGVYALTPTDLTGERYQQQRSYFINGALTAEAGLENAAACIYEDYYILAVNNTLYCLDGLQKAYNENEPYAAYQYECFYLPNIPARTLWVQDGQLHFGTADGAVYAFNNAHTTGVPLFSDTHGQDLPSTAIEASWCTPFISGGLFYKAKHFTRLGVQLAAGANTGFAAHLKQNGAWREIVNAGGAGRYFSWSDLAFSHLSFLAGGSPRVITRKIHARKVDKIQLRIQNHEAGQSFGLEGIGVEYTQSGNFMG